MVVITQNGLGAVTLAMSLKDAEVAAGVTFGERTFLGEGDHAIYPAALQGKPELYWTPGCMGAYLPDDATPVRTVRTAEGVQLGDDLPKLTTTYPSQLKFVPRDTGPTPSDGYVIDYPESTMAFSVSDGHVTEIRLGRPGLASPSGCPG